MRALIAFLIMYITAAAVLAALVYLGIRWLS
jgi:hypothetical protein